MTDLQIREREVSLNGLRMRVLETDGGGRPPLVLLHGLMGRAESWDSLFEPFAEHFQVIAPDLRGHHRSAWPESGYALVDYVGDITGLLETMDIGRAAVVGHSLGALVALLLAVEAPETVSALVLEDPPTELRAEIAQWLQALLAAKRLPREITALVMREIYPHRTEADWLDYTDWLHATADGPFEALLQGADTQRDFLTMLASLTMPVLMLRGDPEAGSAVSDPIAAQCREAIRSGELRTVPNAGHSVHLDQPDEYIDIVLPFLLAHSTSGSVSRTDRQRLQGQ